MTKQELGKQIEALRKECGVSTYEQHWKAFALFFKNVMKSRGMNENQLAIKAGMQRSTINRFFKLEFCLRFDNVLKIAHALELNLFFETRDSKTLSLF